jgi:hypothetical protein
VSDRKSLQEKIIFKIELRIYKQAAHQHDNVNNCNSFHGASNCENTSNWKSNLQVSVTPAAGGGGDLINLDLIRSPLLPRAINCRKQRVPTLTVLRRKYSVHARLFNVSHPRLFLSFFLRLIDFWLSELLPSNTHSHYRHQFCKIRKQF